MAKSGRNDPCPCGSGKKYKQCCLKARPGLASRLPEVFKAERAKAESVARRWLGQEDGPLLDAKGNKLRLVMDRFSVDDPAAVRQVRALGKTDQERVLFYDGGQWIGEADFSVAGHMLLLTPGPQHGDRLLGLLRTIDGLTHLDRQIDELAQLDNTTASGGAGLLDFKSTFFTAWLDEPNQRLEDATPRQAATSPQLRPLLIRLLDDLEDKEKRLPKGERFSFSGLKSKLGVC